MTTEYATPNLQCWCTYDDDYMYHQHVPLKLRQSEYVQCLFASHIDILISEERQS